jgi:hydrogenase/urease accessory protein HupE
MKPADYPYAEAVIVAFVILFGIIIVQTVYG